MAGFFDDLENTTSPVGKSFFDDLEPVEPKYERTLGSTLKDAAISVGRGALGIPGMLTGLADLPIALATGTRPVEVISNYVGEKTGLQPGKLADKLAESYSPVQKQSEAEINKVWNDESTNAVDVAKAYITNPGYTTNKVLEAIPSMAVGGVASKAIMGAGKIATAAIPAVEGAIARQTAQQGAGIIERKLAEQAIAKLGPNATPEAIAAAEQAAYRTTAAIAGGAGEGLVTAGQAMDQAEGTDNRKNALSALGAGAVTAAIGFGAGKVAQGLGLETAETAMAKSFNDRVETEIKTGLSKYGKTGAVAAGALSEGILQELPQSAQEQVWSNYANGKPLWEGVNRAAVEGAMAGFAMGGGANLISGKNTNNKSFEEIALDKRASNILALDKEQLNQSIQKLSSDLKVGQEILLDINKLEAKAKELNIEPAELLSKTVYENKGNKDLLDKVNAGVKAKEDLIKKKDAEEYAKLSPEEKVIKDVENKLIAQKEVDKQKIITEAQKINKRLDAIDKIETIFSKTYAKESEPEKKKQMADRVFSLRKEKNTLLGKQKELVENKTFAPYTTREERQKALEETFGTANINLPVNKDAAESASVFDVNAVQQESILQRINEEKDLNKKQELQTLYDKVFQNFEKDAVESAQVFNQNSDQLDQAERSRKEQDYSNLINQLVAEKKRPFNIDAFNEATTKSAEESAVALDKAGMFKGQASSFTDERQVPLTDNQQIIVDKNNVEIAKLTEQKDRTVDRDERIDALNKIAVLEKDNALIRTSVEQFDALEEDQIYEAPAWHGTPYLFDKFSLSKIGTGEGAQAYGYGLYFAENKEVAEWYRDTLTNATKEINNLSQDKRDKIYTELRKQKPWRELEEQDSKEIEYSLNKIKEGSLEDEDISFINNHYALYDAIKSANVKIGKLYKVDLAPTENELLNWDKPLSEQPDKVKEGIRSALVKSVSATNPIKGKILSIFSKLSKTLPNNVTGRELYDSLSEALGKEKEMTGGWITQIKDDKAASEYLHALGIRGVKYLDGNSRGKGDGNSNYVIFNDVDVSITEIFQALENQVSNVNQTSTKQETSLGNILSQVKSAEGLTGQLANFIADFIPESKLDIKVVIDPSAKSASYVGGQVNTITLRDPSQLSTSLHELTHAVTVREMKANPAITAQVKLLMERVKLKAVKEAILTPAQIKLLETETTSLGYKENISGNLRFENVAYGLLNEYEFLAQAMGNSQFQELLKATTIADKGVLRNAWDAFVELVMKALGIQETSKNAFGEALSIIAKLASQENVNQFTQGSNESLADATSRIQNLPAFKKWFGDSKVVDLEGNPEVYYHGTVKRFNEFIPKYNKKEQLGFGVHFTKDKAFADLYAEDKTVRRKGFQEARTLPVYLKAEKPLYADVIAKEGTKEYDLAYKIAGKKYPYLFMKDYTDKMVETGTKIVYLRSALDSGDPQIVEKYLKELGYDSVFYTASLHGGSINGVISGGVQKADSIIILNPTSIKSIQNQGTWNEDVSNIYESLEVEQRLPQSEYDAVYTEKNNRLSEFVQNAGIKYHEVKLLADKAFGAISTRLKKVDPELSEHLRWLDFKTSQKIIDILRTAKPLLETTKTMSPTDKSEWNWARLNSDTGKIERIESKYGLSDQVKLLREKIDQIREEAIAVGYDVGFIEDYWPRVIKDTEGFLQATQGISQRAEFTEAIRDKAKELGITQKQFEREYPELKADIISNMILGRYYGIGGPGNIKARVFENIPPEYAKFYMDADASLMQYVYSMTKKIEARRFFGKVPERISKLKADRNRKQADLIKFTQLAEMARADNPKAFADYQDRITQINEDLVRIEEPLNVHKHQNDYTENIGAYIDEMRITGRIQPKDEKTVKDILMARFNEQGTHGVVNTFKNAAYIDVMANPISAITQIGDLAWAMYVGKVWTPSGLLGTARNLGKAIVGKSEITKEDLGFERIAQEFADGTTLGKAVSKAFKLVGLEKIDTIGKEVLINNALDQYKAEAKRNPEALAAKIKPTFGNKSLDVVQEILADVPSDNVKMLLYSKVLDFQPAALSEMPEYYLTAGNGRVAYMLKTYTLKQMDVFRREVVQNLKSSDPKQKIQGLTNMVQLLALLTLANAGADELKDWMLGKETRFSDNVIDNLLVMGGASRYTQMQISKEGFGSAMLQQILPPMKFINSASKDLHEGYKNYVSGDTSSFDHARIVDSLPFAGKLYYWHYGRGEENKKSLAEKDFSTATKAADLFKKQLENSTDKRTFIEANLDLFKQMKLQENFQAALSRNKAVINKLEKLPRTENVQMRLGQLKNQREQILKKYLDVAKTIQ